MKSGLTKIFRLGDQDTRRPGTINIVAHQDDDLLFLSPDLIHDIRSGRRVRTVFITAGDWARGDDYWQLREEGSRVAYAAMAEAPNEWVKSDAEFSGKGVCVFTLIENPGISLVFMRLPDGAMNGDGFPAHLHQSLRKIWQNTATTIRAVDGSARYTRESLLRSLTTLITDFQPDQIKTLDYVGRYGDWDHSDHHTAAYLARAAAERCREAPTLVGYRGYPIHHLPANLQPEDVLAKESIFFEYAKYDAHVGGSREAIAGKWGYERWLERQYRVDQPAPAEETIADPAR